MSHKKPILRRVGFILFIFAAILGILLILLRAVPDLEASLYGFIKFNYPPLRSLSCPMLMTILDREPVTVRLNNPLDKTLSFYVNSQFSTGSVFDTREERLDLQPGETRTLSWEVGEENIDLNNFIFARVFTTSTSTLKMRESTCGTFVLRLPIKGGPVIYYVSLFVSILCAAVGAGGGRFQSGHRCATSRAGQPALWWTHLL